MRKERDDCRFTQPLVGERSGRRQRRRRWLRARDKAKNREHERTRRTRAQGAAGHPHLVQRGLRCQWRRRRRQLLAVVIESFGEQSKQRDLSEIVDARAHTRRLLECAIAHVEPSGEERRERCVQRCGLALVACVHWLAYKRALGMLADARAPLAKNRRHVKRVDVDSELVLRQRWCRVARRM